MRRSALLVVAVVPLCASIAVLREGAPVRAKAQSEPLEEQSWQTASTERPETVENPPNVDREPVAFFVPADPDTPGEGECDNPEQPAAEEDGLETWKNEVREFAAADPRQAAEWANSVHDSAQKAAALEQIAVAWAEQDLTGASEWVLSLEEGPGRAIAASSVAYEAARSDPLQSLRLAELIPMGEERILLTEHAVSQWASMDAGTAADWVQRVTDPELRNKLVASAAIAMADTDAASAATLVGTSVGAGDTQNAAAVAVIQRWAQRQPEQAACWLLQFPETPTRKAGGEALVGSWEDVDPAGASTWAHNLPEGDLRETCIHACEIAGSFAGGTTDGTH